MTIETSNQIQNSEQSNEVNLENNTVTGSERASSVHQPTLFAEPVFNLGGFTITNSLLSTWVVLSFILLISVAIRLSLKRVPKGIQNYFEVVVDGALNLADSVTGSRAKSLKFFPIVFPLFLFILLNNWLGILPGVGSVGFNTIENGHQLFIPYLRGGTADLNTTLALAIVVVVATHIASVTMTSGWKYLNRFIGVDLFLELPKKIFKQREYTSVLVNPIKFLVGIIEIVGEFAKVASLSFRLFGNIFAGEVLLGAMAAIFAYLLPVPFIFLEIIVGLVQAMIFSILTLAFLTVMTTDHSEAH